MSAVLLVSCGNEQRQTQTAREQGKAGDQLAAGQIAEKPLAPTSQSEGEPNVQLSGGQNQDNQPAQATDEVGAASGQGVGGQTGHILPAPTTRVEVAVEQKVPAPKITFIELGSVNCIPCKAMQPVMRAIEQKYGEQVRVVFYDVWTPEEQKYGRTYGIRIIPTQVFLDQHGKEIMRHEGFFAEAEIDRFLQSQGLKVLQES